jgi:hypothetical protein
LFILRTLSIAAGKAICGIKEMKLNLFATLVALSLTVSAQAWTLDDFDTPEKARLFA